MQKMKKKDLDFFEKLLNEKKETLLKELGYYQDNAMGINQRTGSGDGGGVSYHLADQAMESLDTEHAFALASREGKLLNHLEGALRKVRDKTYGICESCQELIPRARLEAVPVAKMCIDCKTKKEQEKAEK